MSITQLLNELKFTGDLKLYLKDAYQHIKKEKICYLDINLQSDIYPYLAYKHGLSETTMKTKFIRLLHDYNEENQNIIKDYFKVSSKITVRKLLILILSELK